MLKHVRAQRGMSLVELMVGVTVGLFVAAAASMLTATQLAENRKLLYEAQLQQDLRSTADIITRELRRAGYSNSADAGVWPPQGTPGQNPFDAVVVTGSNNVVFKYRRGPGQEGPYGFRLDASSHAIQTQLASGGWQELTDPRTLKVTGFNVTPVLTPETILPCPRRCADGSTDCWPRHSVREYLVDISAQAANNVSIQRSVSTTVRLRNDLIRYADPLNPTKICPE